MINPFRGSEVCCGTYACINYLEEIKDFQITDYKSFEIASSVPFGICYKDSPRHDRMLTPVCDPNPGINRAASIYGYRVRQYDFETIDILIDWLKKNLIQAPVILGPVDMGKLFYLPMSGIYEAVDHYIVLSWLNPDQVVIIDSEGTGRIRCTYENFKKWISIHDIPEANQKLTVRRLIRERRVSREDIVKQSWMGAVGNYRRVERSGKNAFLSCAGIVKQVPAYLWRNSLLYEIAVLSQRKLLFALLLEQVKQADSQKSIRWARLEGTLKMQIAMLGRLFGQVQQNRIEDKIFSSLAEMEDEIGYSVNNFTILTGY